MTRARRRTRLALTLAGLAFAIWGIVIYGQGTVAEGVAEQAAINASGDDWMEVLGRPSSGWTDADEARWDMEVAESDQTLGILMALAGLGIAAGRFAVRPTARLVGGEPGQVVDEALGLDADVVAALGEDQQQAPGLP
ncbi:hypothetical protein [Streptomyces sp. NPDC002889]|uniref:hypothetical protein n=1 Tax=Streptomyces sp. NPDC002889 TaxID=3364669 RepID=UPI00368C6397